jgi:hypothetical protein
VTTFIQKHASDVIGVLSGFDRLVFRGTARQLAYVEGMRSFLSARSVLLKDFGGFAETTSARVVAASVAKATEARRPVIYLNSPKLRKDEGARAIAEHDGITDGLICVFKTVELLQGFDIYRNRDKKRLELVMRPRKCTHLYHYFAHPVFGFMHVRVQTWFPFQVQIWINGREWLARTLAAKKIPFERRENCFPWIANVERAQRLMNEQLQVAWPFALEILRHQAHPAHEEVLAPCTVPYYWSVYQSEWATDVMFRDRKTLRRLYDRLVHQGIIRFQSRDVLRFLGKKVPAEGIDGRFHGEVTSDIKQRPEGIRLKHRVGANSIKVYDKQGTILRAEMTMNDPSEFKVYRTAEGDDAGPLAWRQLRNGVADLQRRTQISQSVNDRYLDALASIEDATPIGELTRDVCRHTTWKGRRVRALHPWSPDDLALLQAIGRAEFNIAGFRNADLRALLYKGEPPHSSELRRRSGVVTRKIRLLRAHGLIQKRPKTHRYALTPKGQRIVSAFLAAHAASAESLMNMAA